MQVERLYVVQWSDTWSANRWQVVKDQVDGRLVPAAYDQLGEAEHRRLAMADEFPDVSYRVVGFEHAETIFTGRSQT